MFSGDNIIGVKQLHLYRLFNVFCWLWNTYEGAELSSVYLITNTKTLYNLFSPDPAVSCVDFTS